MALTNLAMSSKVEGLPGDEALDGPLGRHQRHLELSCLLDDDLVDLNVGQHTVKVVLPWGEQPINDFGTRRPQYHLPRIPKIRRAEHLDPQAVEDVAVERLSRTEDFLVLRQREPERQQELLVVQQRVLFDRLQDPLGANTRGACGDSEHVLHRAALLIGHQERARQAVDELGLDGRQRLAPVDDLVEQPPALADDRLVQLVEGSRARGLVGRLGTFVFDAGDQEGQAAEDLVGRAGSRCLLRRRRLGVGGRRGGAIGSNLLLTSFADGGRSRLLHRFVLVRWRVRGGLVVLVVIIREDVVEVERRGVGVEHVDIFLVLVIVVVFLRLGRRRGSSAFWAFASRRSLGGRRLLGARLGAAGAPRVVRNRLGFLSPALFWPFRTLRHLGELELLLPFRPFRLTLGTGRPPAWGPVAVARARPSLGGGDGRFRGDGVGP
eukprot:TRINITY_DN3472_c0_g1_i3.p1 TRINITY_DN3472_c0_g1~~TRINITY_DN3472_c0_g1_i3.p1  ORF type:complete len:436 (+),score=63.35 TRINITY_DN3472_c0_g1_i3:198-1505(+)